MNRNTYIYEDGTKQLIDLSDNAALFLEEEKDPFYEARLEKARKYKLRKKPIPQAYAEMRPTLLINDPDVDETYMFSLNNAIYLINHFVKNNKHELANDMLDVLVNQCVVSYQDN